MCVCVYVCLRYYLVVGCVYVSGGVLIIIVVICPMRGGQVIKGTMVWFQRPYHSARVALVAKVGPKRVNLIHMHARVSSQLQQEEGHQS